MYEYFSWLFLFLYISSFQGGKSIKIVMISTPFNLKIDKLYANQSKNI